VKTTARRSQQMTKTAPASTSFRQLVRVTPTSRRRCRSDEEIFSQDRLAGGRRWIRPASDSAAVPTSSPKDRGPRTSPILSPPQPTIAASSPSAPALCSGTSPIGAPIGCGLRRRRADRAKTFAAEGPTVHDDQNAVAWIRRQGAGSPRLFQKSPYPASHPRIAHS